MVMSLDAGVIKAIVHGDVLGRRCIDANFATFSLATFAALTISWYIVRSVTTFCRCACWFMTLSDLFSPDTLALMYIAELFF